MNPEKRARLFFFRRLSSAKAALWIQLWEAWWENTRSPWAEPTRQGQRSGILSLLSPVCRECWTSAAIHCSTCDYSLYIYCKHRCNISFDHLHVSIEMSQGNLNVGHWQRSCQCASRSIMPSNLRDLESIRTDAELKTTQQVLRMRWWSISELLRSSDCISRKEAPCRASKPLLLSSRLSLLLSLSSSFSCATPLFPPHTSGPDSFSLLRPLRPVIYMFMVITDVE